MDLKKELCRHDQQVRNISFSQLLLLLLPLLLLVPSSCAPARLRGWEGFSISGKTIDVAGNPVIGSYVYAYQEGRISTLGPADAMSEPTGEDGVYTLTLSQGSYTLIARRRQSGSIGGPLKNGDLSGRLSETISTDSRDRPGMDITMKPFSHGFMENPNHFLISDTRIMGTVVDPEGFVLSGINVFAYKGSFRQDQPDYVGLITDREGRFEISLPGGGEYTIVARTGSGDRPGPNDSIGFLGEKDHPIEVKGGKVLKGVRIILRPYQDAVTR